MLTDGTSLTGLLDFESVRLADPLFDAAWWAWAVSFSSPSVLEAAWPEFLQGAGLDATDPDLPVRVRSLQVLRMLELLVGEKPIFSRNRALTRLVAGARAPSYARTLTDTPPSFLGPGGGQLMRRPRGMLAARSVSKSYGEMLILDRVSLAVAPETRIGVVGPNGIGKTTLLRILAGLETPESGTVTREPPDVTVAYLAQEAEEADASRARRRARSWRRC